MTLYTKWQLDDTITSDSKLRADTFCVSLKTQYTHVINIRKYNVLGKTLKTVKTAIKFGGRSLQANMYAMVCYCVGSNLYLNIT